MFLGGRYIEVFSVEASGWNRTDQKDKAIDKNFIRKLKEDEEEEDVAESGRLFVRNLPYTCTEDEITQVFSKHGELNVQKTDEYIPIEALCRKSNNAALHFALL